ncbi:MAG: hypothetical protein ACRD7E_13470 [Bryobacteraceae bacterium]
MLVSRMPQRMMVHCISVVVTAGVFGTSALPQQEGRTVAREHTQTSAGIVGVWKVTELLSRSPGENWTNVSPQLSLYIFTKRHYSYMFTVGGGPRPLFAGDPNKPTDAEMVAAYKTFVAAAGTYALSGPTLTFNATMAKNPNEMMGKPLIYTVQLNGDVLRMTITSPPFSPGRERRTVLTRVE